MVRDSCMTGMAVHFKPCANILMFGNGVLIMHKNNKNPQQFPSITLS